jgi:hypothetical protein
MPRIQPSLPDASAAREESDEGAGAGMDHAEPEEDVDMAAFTSGLEA